MVPKTKDNLKDTAIIYTSLSNGYEKYEKKKARLLLIRSKFPNQPLLSESGIQS